MRRSINNTIFFFVITEYIHILREEKNIVFKINEDTLSHNNKKNKQTTISIKINIDLH